MTCNGSPGKPGVYQPAVDEGVMDPGPCPGCAACEPCERCGGSGDSGESVEAAAMLSESVWDCPRCKGIGREPNPDDIPDLRSGGTEVMPPDLREPKDLEDRPRPNATVGNKREAAKSESRDSGPPSENLSNPDRAKTANPIEGGVTRVGDAEGGGADSGTVSPTHVKKLAREGTPPSTEEGERGISTASTEDARLADSASDSLAEHRRPNWPEGWEAKAGEVYAAHSTADAPDSISLTLTREEAEAAVARLSRPTGRSVLYWRAKLEERACDVLRAALGADDE